MFGLLDFRQWRRVRYADPRPAADAFGRLARNTAQLELRLRPGERHPERQSKGNHGEGTLALYVGGEAKWINVLERMAKDFGLTLELAHPAPKPVARVYVPGEWATCVGEADAKILPGGMYVGVTGRGVKDQTNQPGAAVVLPPLTLGLHTLPTLPYVVESPENAVWHVGEGGLPAPARLVGDASAQLALLTPLAQTALTNPVEDPPFASLRGAGGRDGGTATLIVDGIGELSEHLRQLPEVARLVTGGQAAEFSLHRPGLRGFNPLAESALGEAATLMRWRWWLRGVGVHEPTAVEAAYRSGARNLADLAKFWASDPRMLTAAHAADRLISDAAVAAWLSGNFDFDAHLGAGGHILIDAPEARGGRVQALRGALGLALEAAMAHGRAYRILSVGVNWQESDWQPLENLSALHAGKGAQWDVMAFTRCGPELADKIAASFGDAHLAEYLRTLPDGAALAAHRSQGKWWALAAGEVAHPPSASLRGAGAEKRLCPLLQKEALSEHVK
jgi:hypothetical protein